MNDSFLVCFFTSSFPSFFLKCVMGRVATGIAFAALIGLCSAFYIKIEPREERCFSYDFSGNSEVKVSLSVHRGGLLDIRYKVC